MPWPSGVRHATEGACHRQDTVTRCVISVVIFLPAPRRPLIRALWLLSISRGSTEFSQHSSDAVRQGLEALWVNSPTAGVIKQIRETNSIACQGKVPCAFFLIILFFKSHYFSPRVACVCACHSFRFFFFFF